ncbi:response regulator [Xanthomarina sp. F2636L]|uniref:tetratricopeptide repeat-containing hybrid sensor histidine kinase/response regulator n=1 Tax=Xanthomarina sp. F2636L TaxID=2996018 RepID=UPI00225E6D7A|nr:response regulator [Xanthomarina sp. F2636L]MCX7550831.1 ATP-binding protein [Xanthomarina sp. F2636L]
MTPTTKNIFLLLSVIFNLFFSYGQELNTKKLVVDKEISELIDSSRVFFNSNEYDKSLENAKKALTLTLKHNDSKQTAIVYNLIGLNYSHHEDDDNAIKYFNRSLVYATKIKNDTILSWVYNNLGNLYAYNKKDNEIGAKYYLKAIEHSKKVNRVGYLYYLANLANIYIDDEYFEKGKRLLDEIEPHLNEFEKERELHFYYYFLTGNYNVWRNFNVLAEENYIKAYQICLERPKYFPKSHELEICQLLKEFYKKTNVVDKLEEFTIKTDSLQKILLDLEQNENIELLSQKIEKEEVKSKLVKVEAEKEIQDQKLANLKLLSILVVVIFLGILLLLYYQFKLNKIRKINNEELKHTNEALKVAKEKAEEATLLKTQFVSTISHELRTPLYGVIGITDIIETEHKELENSPHLKALKFSANYLLALVNDVLKVHKFEENSVVLENNRFDIEEKLYTIKDSLSVIAKKHRNKIVVDVDTKIPQFVLGDSIRLSQIIINLVSNSLKFTTDGTVSITAKLENQESNLVYISFTISDTGVGIPLEYQEKIFEKFVQINRKEDDYQGTGIGLSIVKNLVTLFKGTISLKSEENVGTSVVFTIPLEFENDTLEKPINNIEDVFFEDFGLKILLVEDNKINQMVTKKLLENNKYVCDIADDGFMALEMLKNTTYDAILMDINMPKINGYETTKLIREKGITVPVIALTAFEREEVYDTAIASGIDDIIAKPFDTRKLLKMIRKYSSES